MNKALAIFTALFIKMSVLSQRVTPYDFDMDYDEIEDYKRISRYEFSASEEWRILIGGTLIVIGWLLSKKDTDNQGQAGCLPQGLLILGFVLILPLISALLHTVDLLIRYAIQIGLVVLVGYFVINEFFNKN